MRFTPDNFLYLIKQLVTGTNRNPSGTTLSGPADGGIKVDKNIPLTTVDSATADFPVITDSTTGTASTTFGAIAGVTYATDAPAIKNALAQIAKQFNALNLQFGKSVSSIPVIQVATAGTVVGTVQFAVPRDYDEASDALALRVVAAVANAADNATTVVGTPTIQPIATGTASTKAAKTGTAPFMTANLLLTTTPQVFDISLSGLGLKRDDIVAVAITLGGSATANGATNVYSLEYTYESTLVSYHDTDNFAETGHALR